MPRRLPITGIRSIAKFLTLVLLQYEYGSEAERSKYWYPQLVSYPASELSLSVPHYRVTTDHPLL